MVTFIQRPSRDISIKHNNWKYESLDCYENCCQVCETLFNTVNKRKFMCGNCEALVNES